jgi:hypothetical protein
MCCEFFVTIYLWHCIALHCIERKPRGILFLVMERISYNYQRMYIHNIFVHELMSAVESKVHIWKAEPVILYILIK